MVRITLSRDSTASAAHHTVRRWFLALACGLAPVGLWVAATLGSELVEILFTSQPGKWMRLRFLQYFLAGYVAVMFVAPVGAIASAFVGLRARRRRNRPAASLAGRVFLLCASLLIGIGTSEAFFALRLRMNAQPVHPDMLARGEIPKPIAEPEIRAGADARPLRQVPPTPPADGTLDVVIVGESSAAGVPFSPRLSLDKIIAWQLGRALPGRSFRAVNLAVPGATFQKAIEEFGRLERRPGLLIVYAGHNEFQSRFGWDRKATHYPTELSLSLLYERIRTMSATADFVSTDIARFGFAAPPSAREANDKSADSPCCTLAEYAEVVEDYRRRLDGLLGDCGAAGIPSMVIVTPSNDGAFDPNRSIMSPESSVSGQRDFLARLRKVRVAEDADPARAMAAYRLLIAEQPSFAETHYRLAQLLEAAGSFDEARERYIRARDLDGLPFRCPTPFLDASREIGKRHGAIVVDGPRLLAAASPHGIVNDRLFQDAQHPSLNAFVILARDAIQQLKERKAFGWPDSSPAPSFTMADCIRQFKLDRDAWVSACKGTAWFYKITATMPRDPSWRKSVKAQYERAMEMLRSGKTPDETGIPALKIGEELRADSFNDQGASTLARELRGSTKSHGRAG